MKKKVLRSVVCLVGAVLLVAGVAHANPAIWDTSFAPSYRDDAGTIYTEWLNIWDENHNPRDGQIFDNTPDVASVPANMNFTFDAQSPGQLLNLMGSVMNFGNPNNFTVTASGNSAVVGTRDAVLHVGSAYKEFDYTNITLNGETGTWTELFDGPFTSPFGHVGREKEFTIVWEDIPDADTFVFDVPGLWDPNPGDAGGEGVTQVSIDLSGVSAVPVPAAVWLLGSGMAGLLGIRRLRMV